MTWPHRDIDPATIRIPFLMGVIGLFDRDVAAIDVVAKSVEPRRVGHYEVVDLIGFIEAAVGNVNRQLHRMISSLRERN